MNRLLFPYCFLLCCLLMINQPLMAESASETVDAANVEKPPLHIGIPVSRRPYAYLDTEKQPAGILVNAIQRLCQQMKVTCSFDTGNPEQLLLDLQAVKLNAVLIVDTFIAPEVDKIKLTPPLCKPAPMFIQKAGTPARSKPEDFRGNTLAVQEGSIFHIYLLDEYSGQTRLKPYPFMDNAVFDLVFGRLDALFADEAFIQSRITGTALQGYVQFTTTRLDVPELPATAMTLAVREQDNNLFKELATALQTTSSGKACAQLLATDTAKPKE